MAIKIRLRRFVALLLCCVLVGSSFPVQVHATDPVTAASLAITGGQLAGAGLSGEAALSLAGPVGAVVGVTLGALGLNAYVSKAAQEAGKTRTRFVLDKLVIWGAQAGYAQEQLYSKIAEGVSVAADGTIQLTRDVAQMIQQFGNWAIMQDGLVVESPGGSSMPDYSVGSVDFQPVIADGFYSFVASGCDSVKMPAGITNAYAVICKDTHGSSYKRIIILSSVLVDTKLEYYLNGNKVSQSSLSRYSDTTADGKYYMYSARFPGFVSSDIPQCDYYENNLFDLLYSTNGSYDTSVSADDVFTGTPESWAENKDVLNPSAEDTPVVLNPDLLNPIIDSLADGQQATMSIIDYLQALQDAWDHALDDVQTAIGTITDSLTGIQEQIAVPQDAVENPTVTNPSVTPETTPVLDPSAVDPGTAVTGLSFDLTQIFPFCIPFDIYDMLATLSATPEAPVYHVHYEGPYNILIDFTVDLSPWDSVASVLRTVELLAFCIGLAYVTRSMFIRS